MQVMPSTDASGIILVGGRSRRFGRPKALVRIGPKSCIEHVVAAMKPVTRDLLLVGDAEGLEFLNLPRIPDERPGCGPLGGLAAGLSASRSERSIVAACDMPCITPDLFSLLLERVGGRDAAIPKEGERLHPLCAVYSKSSLPVIRERLNSGLLKILDLARSLRCEVVSVDEDDSPIARSLFINMNTPEDIPRAESALADRP